VAGNRYRQFGLIAIMVMVLAMLPYGVTAKPATASNLSDTVSEKIVHFNNLNNWTVSYYNGGIAPVLSNNVLTITFPPDKTSNPFAATDVVSKYAISQNGSLALSFNANTNKNNNSKNGSDGFAVFCTSDIEKFVGAEFGFIYSLDTGNNCVQGYMQDPGGTFHATGLFAVSNLADNHQYKAEAVLAGGIVTVRFYVDDVEFGYIDGSSHGWNTDFLPVMTVHNVSGVATKNLYLRISNLSLTSGLTMALFPDAAGDSTQLYTGGSSPAFNNWKSTSDYSANDSVTYIENNTDNYLMDLYNFDNNIVSNAYINSVTFFVRVIKSGTGGFFFEAKTKGVTDETAVVYPANSWTTYSHIYKTNPVSGVAWTWNDINDLQAGVKVFSASGSHIYITQVYVVVEYAPALP